MLSFLAFLPACTQAAEPVSSSAQAAPTEQSSPHPTQNTTARPPGLADPRRELLDVDQDLGPVTAKPLVHEKFTGTKTWDVSARVQNGLRSVRVSVACSPAGDFKFTMGKSFWGQCSPSGGPQASISISSDVTRATLSVQGDRRVWIVIAAD